LPKTKEKIKERRTGKLPGKSGSGCPLGEDGDRRNGKRRKEKRVARKNFTAVENLRKKIINA